MGIYLLDIYRSSNIGIFIKTNDKHLLIPEGMAETKALKLSEYLGVESIHTSIAGSRLIGSLSVMNNSGILVSSLAEDQEIKELAKSTGLPVERLPSKYTSVGNLVVANDKGAIVSSLMPENIVNIVGDVLDVTVETMTIASHVQVGSMIVATNQGAIIHPSSSEGEVSQVSRALKVDTEPATINRGIPIIASGLVANSRNAVAGNLTTGIEIVMMSRSLKV